MRAFSSILRKYLNEHRRRTWIVGLASGASSLFGYWIYFYQLLGLALFLLLTAAVVSLVVFGWPIGKSVFRYFRLQSLYYEEVERLSRAQSVSEPSEDIAKAIEVLFTPYTTIPKTRTLRHTVEIPLYPPFEVGEIISKLLSLPCFLRLDEIEQLSFAHHIFEGAKHSRREHVLGVMYLMKEVCDRFVKKGLLTERDSEIAQVAALIHDMFHTPYGHALDGIGRLGLKDGGTISGDWKYDRGRLILALQKDAWFKLALIDAGLTEEEIKILLRIFKFEKEELEWFLDHGKYFFIANLVQGESIDLDRLDYVGRDAIHTFGVSDALDYKRLLSNIVEPDTTKWVVLFKEQAADLLRTVEVLRYKNFALVYESDENASAEEMVSHALYRLYKRMPLSRESLRQLLMLSDHELESIISRFGGEYEKWMIKSALHEAGSYVAVATYPTNLEDVSKEGERVKFDRITEIFSKKTVAGLSDGRGGWDEGKASAFISSFSKKLKFFQTAKLNPRKSPEAFNEKVLAEHNFDEKSSSVIMNRREILRKRGFPLEDDLNPDEPIFFVRGAVEEPWSENYDVQILDVQGKSMSLREYFGHTVVASPKVYGIRIFAPLEFKDAEEELRSAFESYIDAMPSA